jgi:hypothetical protein
MNLWVKGKGLLALVLLIALFSSCEDEENTIGLPVQNQLDLKYLEYEVPVEMVWTDSVISQNPGIIYSGRFDLDEAGILTATPYISFAPQAYDTNINVPSGAVFKDFYLELDYVGGLSTDEASTESFEVYQLEDTINGFVQHFIEDQQALGQLIGEKTFTFYPDSLNLDIERDSIDYREIISLDQTMGEDLLGKLKQQDPEIFNSRKAFDIAFKGIAIVPGNENSAIPGFSPAQSQIVIEYEYEENGDVKNGRFIFKPTNKYYHNITPNKTEMTFNGGTFSDITCCYEGYTPAGNFIYQMFGTGINIKLDLTAFKSFSDTLNTTLLNSAILELDDVESTTEHHKPVSNIAFYLTNENGRRLSGQKSNIDFYRALTAEKVNLDPVRLGDPSIVPFNPVQESYTADITLFMQHLIKDPSTPGYLLLEAADPVAFGNLIQLRRSSRRIGAIQIPKGSIKVKLYYSTIE